MWFVIGEKRCTEMNKSSLKSLAYFLGDILIQKSIFFCISTGYKKDSCSQSYPALPWALSSLWNSGCYAKNLLPSSSEISVLRSCASCLTSVSPLCLLKSGLFDLGKGPLFL